MLHPIQRAVEALHHHTTMLHHATAHIDFGEKHKVVEILLGLLPEVAAAAQELIFAAFTYLSERGAP